MAHAIHHKTSAILAILVIVVLSGLFLIPTESSNTITGQVSRNLDRECYNVTVEYTKDNYIPSTTTICLNNGVPEDITIDKPQRERIVVESSPSAPRPRTRNQITV